MKKKKKIISFILAVFMLMNIFPAMVSSAEYIRITDRSEVSGYSYTLNAILASKLNDIFDGNANIYSNYNCTTLLNVAIGTQALPNNGVYRYVGVYDEKPLNIGTSCWIYANGVYYTLFGEVTTSGTPGINSVSLPVSSTPTKSATYENFVSWQVRPGVGALIRANGHSMIVLSYDSERLTVLEGNGDSRGLICITTRTWDSVNYTVDYIIQPTDAFYESLYGDEYYNLCRSGEYPAHFTAKTNSVSHIYSLPCYPQTDESSVIFGNEVTTDDILTITGVILNSVTDEEQYWYHALVKSSGLEGWIPASSIDVSTIDFKNSLIATNTTNPIALNIGSSFVLKGDIRPEPTGAADTTGTRITNVSGYIHNGYSLTGEAVSEAHQDVETYMYSVMASDVDYGLRFGRLQEGWYTYHISATVENYYINTDNELSDGGETSDVIEFRSYFSVGSPENEVFSVLFDSNGGENAPQTISKTHAEDITLPLASPTRAGFVFLGWSTDKEATEPDYLPGDTYAEDGNKTLYAVWEKFYASINSETLVLGIYNSNTAELNIDTNGFGILISECPECISAEISDNGFTVSILALNDGNGVLKIDILDENGVVAGKIEIAVSAISEYKNGLKEEDGKLYYYIKDVKQSGWFTLEGVTYYALSASKEVVTADKVIGGKQYLWNEETGLTLANGFVETENGTVCYYNGIKAIGWRHSDGTPITIDENGVYEQYSSNPQKLYYFLSTTGYMVTDDNYTLGGYKREFNADHTVKPLNGLQIKGLTCRYYIDGKIQLGWQEVDGNKYYFLVSTGSAATMWQQIDGKLYYFASPSSSVPFALKTSGAIGGIEYTYGDSGNIVVTGFMNTAYAVENGNNTGAYIHKMDGTTKYYVNGEVQYGWQFINGNWYYFYANGSSNGSGYMCVTSGTIGGVWYEFSSDGVCTNKV